MKVAGKMFLAHTRFNLEVKPKSTGMKKHEKAWHLSMILITPCLNPVSIGVSAHLKQCGVIDVSKAHLEAGQSETIANSPNSGPYQTVDQPTGDRM